MELTVFDVIKGPVMSDKAYRLNKLQKQLVLRVHPLSTKKQIKSALEQLFNVKVEKVRTAINKKTQSKAAARRFKAQPSTTKKKVAYITLKEGYSLNLFEQAGMNEETK